MSLMRPLSQFEFETPDLESHWLPLSANKACLEIKVVVVEKVTLLVQKVFKKGSEYVSINLRVCER